MNARQFAECLTRAVRTIAARENKTIAGVQDELGYTLGRETGGSSIEYWRKGHVPADRRELEKLTRELARRGGLSRTECKRFLHHAGHAYPEEMLDKLHAYPGIAPAEDDQAPQELSPFVVGPPVSVPRQFFGRERELGRIFGLWRGFPLQHVTVVGPKRSGKTSLLHYLRRITRTPPGELRPGQRSDWLPGPERYRWVYVDFQDVRMSSQNRLLRHILTHLNAPAPNPCALDAFMDIASQYIKQPTVVLMDEISAGLASPELDEPFWWALRSLANNYAGGNLGFVLTAHDPPARLAQDLGKPSPFFNIFTLLELGPLTEAEARELIASSPLPFPPADAAWILEQSGRWPCLLQTLCRARLHALEAGEEGAAWREDGLRQIKPFRYLVSA